MKKFIILSLVLLFSVFAKSQTLQDANMAYKNGEFKKAIQSYEGLLSQDLESYTLYFNLANSYYKTNRLAPSILNYERALLLKPNDRDIRYNLRMARSLVTDKIEEIPVFFLNRWMGNLISVFTSDTWAVFSIISFCLILIILTVFFFSSSRWFKKMSFSMALLFLVLSSSSAIFSSIQKNRLVDRVDAIIYAPSVTIKGSPAASGTELFLLHEGTKVKVIEHLGDWTNIQLSDGNEGWLTTSSIRVI